MSERTSIPENSTEPKQGETPKHIEEPNNLAGDKELCKQVWGWIGKQYEHFKNQDQRRKYADAGGTMDIADRMERVSLRRDETNAQTQDAESNVASTMYHRQIKAVHANISSIIFHGEDLPAEYAPEIDTDEYRIQDGRWIAEQQNMLAVYTMDEDKRRPKIKDSFFYLLKYGNELLTHEWKRTVEVRKERVPVEFDEDTGLPTAFEWQEKERVTADWPTIIRHDMKDCFFDAQIDDMNRQRCLIIRKQEGWEELEAQQLADQIMNVQEITPSHLYLEEDDPHTLEERMRNAEENTKTEPTGLVDEWHAWCRIPIKEGKRKGRGKWAPGKSPSRLYWATFAGRMHGAEAVCLRLIKLPFHHGNIPALLAHSHRDDKGAYHKGLATMLESNYRQATTNIDQAIDNITMKTKAPMITDGRLNTGRLKFKHNMIVKTARGVRFERMVIPDTTTLTMAMHDRIEGDSDKTSGADKPILGERLGGRATAQEAGQVFQQALLPLDEQAEYIANQYFPWMFENDAALWRQFGDPATVLSVTHKNQIIRVKPAQLWGPIKTKVVAIRNFRNSMAKKREINSIINNVLPVAKETIGRQGMRVFLREALKLTPLADRALEIVPDEGDWDAQTVAQEENEMMIVLRQWDEPQPQENHAAHNAVHTPRRKELERLPEDQRDPEIIRMLLLHEQIHDNFAAQTEQQAARAGQQGQEEDIGESEFAAQQAAGEGGAMSALA